MSTHILQKQKSVYRPQIKKICIRCGDEFKTTSKRYKVCQPCWRKQYEDDYSIEDDECVWPAELYGMNGFDLDAHGIYDDREV
jgi:DNA-directed RNA polymerase subunit RPC12/RpoP